MKLLGKVAAAAVCLAGAAAPLDEARAQLQGGGAYGGMPRDASARGQAKLTVAPRLPRVDEPATMLFELTDDQGRPLDELLTHHDRRIHVVLVSEDMRVFGHIHPEDFGEAVAPEGSRVRFTFPRAGRYLVAMDALTGAAPLAEQFLLTVEGDTGDGMPTEPASAFLTAVEADDGDTFTAPILLGSGGPTGGYEVSFTRSTAVRAGEPVRLIWRISKDGSPITDLRHFLAAPMHLAVVKDDLSYFQHGHGTVRGIESGFDHVHGPGGEESTVPATNGLSHFGPEITASLTFPAPGRYYVFSQAAHGKTILVIRSPVDVRS